MPHQLNTSKSVKDTIDGINDENKLRVWSIIITLFGDCIAPRNGEITLSSLQRIFSLFGFEPNALRTALSRLARDGWLARDRHGRHSSYRLTEEGNVHFRSATGRIYKPAPSPWRGEFELVLAPSEDRKEREKQHRKLLAKGFGSPLSGVYIRPHNSNDETEISSLTQMIGRVLGESTPSELIANSWPTQELNQSYKRLESRFGQLLEDCENGAEFTARDSLVLRILLIHEWRRVLLKDVDLPADYKSSDWRGETARELVAKLYHRLLVKSECFLDELESTPGVFLPQPDAALFARFRK